MSKQIASKPQPTVADAERVLAELEQQRGALLDERLRDINPQQRCSLALSYR